MKKEQDIIVDDELIVKYLSGEASPGEALAVSEWLAVAANKAQFAAVEAVWYGTHPHKIRKPRFSKEHAWNTVAVAVRDAAGKESSKPRAASRNLWPVLSARVTAVAAAVMLLAAFGVFLFLRHETVKNTLVSTTDDTRTINLSDNSRATVNRHSTLIYPQQFKGNRREVNLVQGQAFFAVARNEAKPFVVHTPLADVKVLGTQFDVVATTDKTEIRVKEGKVMVYTPYDSMVLTRGATAVFEAGQQKIAGGTVSDANAFGYATHRLVFRDTPLQAVIRDIERAYPCTIKVTNQHIAKCNFTATFDNDSLDNIVSLIAEILNLTVTKDDKTFILEGEGCP